MASSRVLVATLTVLAAVVLTHHGALAASARPQYFDAVVVDAEGRSDDSDESEGTNAQLEDCLLPALPGPCRGYFQSYYYNSKSERCEKFTYSGCGGNNNRFKSYQECDNICRSAKKILASERCGELNPRCENGCFVVSDNRDCPRCECSQKVRATMCSQPPVRGHCRALLRRWRYDLNTKTCSEFKFGGCDGNGNNFVSEQQCLDACSGV